VAPGDVARRAFRLVSDFGLAPFDQGFLEFLQLLTVKIRQPSHEFTFGVGMTFISYPLVLTPVV
jgi:hypothetical protein